MLRKKLMYAIGAVVLVVAIWVAHPAWSNEPPDVADEITYIYADGGITVGGARELHCQLVVIQMPNGNRSYSCIGTCDPGKRCDLVFEAVPLPDDDPEREGGEKPKKAMQIRCSCQ